jgi:hypothetical protein
MGRRLIITNAILATVLVGCATRQRPFPELVEKRFQPNKGGTVEHIKPLNREEQKQYKLAAVGIMKRFCKGKFKVISESGFSKNPGTS